MSDLIYSHSTLLRELVEKGFRPTVKFKKGYALIWAAGKGSVLLVQELLKLGADLTATTEPKHTPLHKAAMNSFCEVTNMLLDVGANIDERGKLGATALHLAAYDGEAETIRLLILRGASTAAQMDAGFFPLHLAAYAGQCSAIQVLGDLQADINCTDEYSRTPLHISCVDGDLDAVQLLLRLGADVLAKDLGEEIPLYLAGRGNHPNVLKYLLEYDIIAERDAKAGPCNPQRCYMGERTKTSGYAPLEFSSGIESKNIGRDTPLATAANLGHTEIARILLNNDARTHTRNDRGEQPLHIATCHQHGQIVQLLIQNGADIEARTNHGNTTLLLAAALGTEEDIRILIEYGADLHAASNSNGTALHNAAATERKLTMRLLLNQGIDIEARNNNGNTALIAATVSGNIGIVSLLISRGANFNTADLKSWQPLHYAASTGHEGIVGLLLDNAADPLAETADGWRAHDLSKQYKYDSITRLLNKRGPVSLETQKQYVASSVARLVSAVTIGNTRQVAQLIARGIDNNAMDINGRRAISSAAKNGREDVLGLLLEAGAKVDLKDLYGESSLWWASRYGHAKVVGQLLAEGPSVDATDNDNQSLLSAASQQGHAEIVGLLLEHGSDPNPATVYGMTPLLFAEIAGHLQIVEILLRFEAKAESKAPKSDTSLQLPERNGNKELATGHTQNLQELQNKPAVLTSNARKRRSYANYMREAAASGRLVEIEQLVRIGVSPSGLDMDVPPIIAAASEGQDAAIEALIRYGASVHATDSWGVTAIYKAAIHDHVSTVKLLHTHGADIEKKDPTGATPLSRAAKRGMVGAVALLIDLGAEKDSKDKIGRTALHRAVSTSQMAVVELLLRSGSNIEAVEKNGYTPLLIAVKRRDRALTKLFLEMGATLRPESRMNRSPLCLASELGFEAAIELLVDYGSDLNHRSENGSTPLIRATRNGHDMTVKILIEAGARHDVKDNNGKTPISYAKEYNHESVIETIYQAHSLRQANERSIRNAQQKELNRRRLYRYQPMKQEGYIRVLELHPGKPGDIISFDLVEVQLARFSSFEALSYEWGGKFGTVPVQCNNSRVLITPNCRAAMERLRQPSQPRYLWIDAICINQNDVKERNSQVAMMADIFRTARSVLMWLGEESESTAAAFKSIPAVADICADLLKVSKRSPFGFVNFHGHAKTQRRFHEIMRDQKVFDGFDDISRRPYFTRAWILQEIILSSSRGIAICGQHQSTWKMLEHALLIYGAYRKRPLSSLITVAFHEYVLEEGDEIDLTSALLSVYTFAATDSRDKVYATLGYASTMDETAKLPEADYTMTVQDVYINATRFCIEEMEGMLIWTYYNRSSTKTVPSLPSWVPDFDFRDTDVNSIYFPSPHPSFKNSFPGNPSTTTSSLHIDCCIVDRVVFRLPLTPGADIFPIIWPMVQALAGQNRSIYDQYPGSTQHKQRRPALPKGRSSQNCFKPNIVTPRNLRNTNGQALLSTIVFPDEIGSKDIDEISSFLAWRLSQDIQVPSCSRTVPEYVQNMISAWDIRSKSKADFDINVYHKMASNLRKNVDLIYTEEGIFGLTNMGETEEGMLVVVVGGDGNLRLLKEMSDGPDKWYQYVDRFWANLLREDVKTLEDLIKDPIIERLEIR